MKRKLQANISYEYIWKSPQQDTSKPSSAKYSRDYTPSPCGNYVRSAKMVQHTKID